MPSKALADRGLGAYARHPLLRAVEIDRSYYEPLPSGMLAAFSEQAPDGFGFVPKPHQACTVRRFPITRATAKCAARTTRASSAPPTPATS